MLCKIFIIIWVMLKINNTIKIKMLSSLINKDETNYNFGVITHKISW